MIESIIDGTFDGNILEALPEGIEPGSIEAKMWWKEIVKEANEEGEYNGKEIAPGITINGGDFKMLVDKLMITQGYDLLTAIRIAGSIKARIYG